MSVERIASSAVAGTYVARFCADGLVVLERLAEIALEQVRQVAQVLDRHRLVEPVALLERRNGGRVGGRLLAEVGGDRVARARAA